MNKKAWIIIGIVVIAAAAAVLIVTQFFGGSHGGIDNDPEADVSGESKILVAYFSWSGNGQQMARWIADETGGELFRIVPEESYGEDYGACADRAKNELDNEIRPALSSHIDADVMAQYDTIYLGFPSGGTICRRRYGHSSKNTIFPARRSFRSARPPHPGSVKAESC